MEEANIPKHIGPNVVPNFPLFVRLLAYASTHQNIAINDVTNNFRATHAQLLMDVLHVRNAIQESLDGEVREQLLRGSEVFVGLLASAGYEFAVGFIAIVALGAVIVPLHFRAIAMFYGTNTAGLAKSPEETIRRTFNSAFKSTELGPLVRKPLISPRDTTVSSDHFLDYQGSGLVIFTSGTTEPPKGAMRRRAFFDVHAQRIADHYELTQKDVVLHCLPVHHITGISTSFMPYILSGACVEFHSGGFNPIAVWDRWRDRKLTVFSGVPTMYIRLMRYYETTLSKLPEPELQERISGARSLRSLLCGTSALPRPLQQKWRVILGGKSIIERHGATEFGSGFAMSPRDTACPDGSVGRVTGGVEVKLSDGDLGEILIKSPNMFSKYIFDPEATAAALDSEGWYKTGDIGGREGDYYFILGRASIDIIKSGGYKISALDIEREILGMDYVSEALVVGIDDEEFGQRSCHSDSPKGRDSQNPHDRASTGMFEVSASKLQDANNATSGSRTRKDFNGRSSQENSPTKAFSSESHPDIQLWKSERPLARL